MRSLAIIPARGGSKRVPGKNLCEVGGRSLLQRAYESAAPCDAVVVSTDDSRIGSLAASWCRDPRLMLHPREPEHATDTANLEDVIADVLAKADNVGAETHGIGVDAIVLLQPTSWWRTAEHVAAALALLAVLDGVDSVVSGFDAGFTVALAERVGSGGLLPGFGERVRSQDAPRMFREDGAIYATTRAAWQRTRSRRGGLCAPLWLPQPNPYEIDTVEDLEAARRLAR